MRPTSPSGGRPATAAAYQRFFDLAPDMFAIVDAGTARIVDCNRALTDASGYARGDLIGRTVFDLYPDDWAAEARRVSREFVRRGQTRDVELAIRRRDGGSVPVSVSVAVGSRHPTGRIAESILILHDMTRRQATEAALKASEARYQDLYHNAPDLFASLDATTHAIVQCNRTLARVTGLDRAALLGRPVDTLFESVSHDAVREALHAAARSGDVRNVHLQLRRVGAPPLEASMHVTRVVDEQRHTYYRLVLRDITERKRAQEALRAAYDELEQRVTARTAELARSNAELEQFAYVASHDLQEPLRKIQAFGERLHARAEAHLDDTGRDYLARMLNAARRMQALIEDLLQLSRVLTRGKPLEPTDLGSVVAGVLSDLDVAVHDSGARVDVGPLPVVVADATQMRQLFQNLLGNALKFRRPEVSPEVVVRAERDPAGDDGGEAVRITVSDNGIGFDAKYRERIFTPFQRLHSWATYEGTGIGLAISRRIVERHDGTLTATSRPGAGATFVVTLPRREAEAAR